MPARVPPGALAGPQDRSRSMQQTTTFLSIAGAATLLAVAVSVLLAEFRARRRERAVLDDSLEMSTLTFPPGSLDPRRRRFNSKA
jgi:ABC-type Fe3+ transport system permease subunit